MKIYLSISGVLILINRGIIKSVLYRSWISKRLGLEPVEEDIQ